MDAKEKHRVVNREYARRRYLEQKLGIWQRKRQYSTPIKRKPAEGHCPRCESLLSEGEAYCEWCLNEMGVI